ncbi:hypothetical protein [Paenibacillus xerothermodurans]|uniref:hypothetical protein n=1 Tax=Paenibacillus xerothermodurans TaxID=1977292 RepID=UPI001401E429|nr:hypothetical protein [Paenibacillus xerothermodurans]
MLIWINGAFGAGRRRRRTNCTEESLIPSFAMLRYIHSSYNGTIIVPMTVVDP